MLTFDPVAHRYEWDGKATQSVTQVIAAALGDPFAGRDVEHARQRGSAVHKACELDAVGCLDESTVAPEIRAYVDAWREFRRSFRPKIIASEMPLYTGLYDYAGTPDFVFCHTHRNDLWGVVDIKSGLLGMRARLQTAGYMHLVGEHFNLRPMACKRFALQLRPSGTFQFVEHDNAAADWRDFLSCLNVSRLKQKEAA